MILHDVPIEASPASTIPSTGPSSPTPGGHSHQHHLHPTRPTSRLPSTYLSRRHLIDDTFNKSIITNSGWPLPPTSSASNASYISTSVVPSSSTPTPATYAGLTQHERLQVRSFLFFSSRILIKHVSTVTLKKLAAVLGATRDISPHATSRTILTLSSSSTDKSPNAGAWDTLGHFETLICSLLVSRRRPQPLWLPNPLSQRLHNPGGTTGATSSPNAKV